MNKSYTLYDVCYCNHENLQHSKKGCSANIPVGIEFFRGILPTGVPLEICRCKKFKFSQENTANPKPTTIGDL